MNRNGKRKKESSLLDCPVRPVSYNWQKALWGSLNMGYTEMVQISAWVPLPLVLVQDTVSQLSYQAVSCSPMLHG